MPKLTHLTEFIHKHQHTLFTFSDDIQANNALSKSDLWFIHSSGQSELLESIWSYWIVWNLATSHGYIDWQQSIILICTQSSDFSFKTIHGWKHCMIGKLLFPVFMFWLDLKKINIMRHGGGIWFHVSPCLIWI